MNTIQYLLAKKGFFYLIFLLMPVLHAQTHTGDLRLSNQAQVDSFNYTNIHGSLIINGPDIKNLDGLSELITIVGDLRISGNDSLANIDGLLNLISVTGTHDPFNLDGLFITNNNSLKNINGLSGLINFDREIYIIDNDSLASIQGLSNIDSAITINIFNNDALQNLQGLHNIILSSIYIWYNDNLMSLDFNSLLWASVLYIFENNSLPNLQGLNKIDSIGYLIIRSNNSLTDLDGIENLRWLGRATNDFNDAILELRNNPKLQNLNGLRNSVINGRGNGQVSNNISLEEFCGIYGLVYFDTNANLYSIFIGGNKNNPKACDILANGPCSIGSSVTNVDGFTGMPTVYSLSQNYPNPFNPNTVIRYSLPEAAFVKLKVYNSLGELVKTLVSETKNAGYYEISFDASSLSSGMYIYKIEAGGFVSSNKMILLK